MDPSPGGRFRKGHRLRGRPASAERGTFISAIQGRIVQGSPMIRARITRGGNLELGRGRLRICVDTGFTGDVALPRRLLRNVRRAYAGPIDYRLATGRIETMDQWTGKVRIGTQEFERIFLEGDCLLGMDFLQEVARSLRINFKRGRVFITLER